MPDAEYFRLPLVRRDDSVRAYTLVSAADFEVLSRSRWFVCGRYVARQGERRRHVYMHREIMGLPSKAEDSREVDHINHDTLDNRRCNLRVVTQAENLQNVGPLTPGASRYRGVARTRCGTWLAQADQVKLGTYATEEEAAVVAADYRRRHMPGTIEMDLPAVTPRRRPALQTAPNMRLAIVLADETTSLPKLAIADMLGISVKTVQRFTVDRPRDSATRDRGRNVRTHSC